MAKDLVLGLDVGGTNTRLGLVGRDFTARHIEVLPSKSLYETGDTIAALAKAIAAYIAKHGAQQEVLAVAAGLPVVVNKQRTEIFSSTNMPGMVGVDIVQSLGEKIGLPVMIDHDAYYLLEHDVWANGLPAVGNYIGLYYGTGMGNAIIINGGFYYGKNGTAAELGHMPVLLDNTPCSCGNVGCIEMHSCGKALERLGREYYPGTPIGELFRQHGGEEPLDTFVRAMAVPAATEINILDPDAVLLGGGIVQMPGYPKEKLVEYILAGTRKPYPAQNLQLIFARDNPANGIIGAARAAFARFG